MRLQDSEYTKAKKIVVDMYLDYNLKTFPISAVELAKCVGLELKMYSTFPIKNQEKLINYNQNGFIIRSKDRNIAYINDINNTKGFIRMTIFHEIKHFVYEDKDDTNDTLADFFAKSFMCPIPYLILKNIKYRNDIAKHCEVSLTVAIHVEENIEKRMAKYGKTIFDYEVPLIQQIDPTLLTEDIKIISE